MLVFWPRDTPRVVFRALRGRFRDPQHIEDLVIGGGVVLTERLPQEVRLHTGHDGGDEPEHLKMKKHNIYEIWF